MTPEKVKNEQSLKSQNQFENPDPRFIYPFAHGERRQLRIHDHVLDNKGKMKTKKLVSDPYQGDWQN